MEKFKVIAETMGIDTRGLTDRMIKEQLMIRIGILKSDVGITNQLKEKGVKTSDTQELARKAVKDACMLTNPQKANRRDLEVINEEAM